MDPRDPKTDRLVAEVEGGGWAILSFSPDRTKAVVIEYVSITKSNLHLLDLASRGMTPIGDHHRETAYGNAAFAPDGTLWVTSDEGSEFQRLGTVDIATGKLTPRTPDTQWDVEVFDIASDGSFIAFVVNEAGISRLELLDPANGRVRRVDSLPAGQLFAISVAPWGEIGLSLSSAKSTADVFSRRSTDARGHALDDERNRRSRRDA